MFQRVASAELRMRREGLRCVAGVRVLWRKVGKVSGCWS